MFTSSASPLLRKGVSALCVVASTLLLSFTASAQSRIITFDAPGADTTPGDFNGTYPSSINVWGAITGSYQDVNSTFHGFLRTPDGKFITFQAPGADTAAFNGTFPCCINDLGVIAGSFVDVNGLSHGFVHRRDGKFTTFDAPNAGGFGTTPLAINLEGAIVGFYTQSDFVFHGFIRKPDGTFITFDGPGACETDPSQGCFGSGASNVNAFGLVAGGFEDNSGNFVHHSLLRTPDGKLRVFDVPAAGTGSYQGTGCPGCAIGLNQWGAIAGPYIDSNSVQHGFFRAPGGTVTTFDAPGAGTNVDQGTGCPSDCPTGLNDRGAIMGTYLDSNYAFHGYLRTPDGKIVTVDPPGSLFTWSSAINDFGMITGYYADSTNVFHAFLRISDR